MKAFSIYILIFLAATLKVSAQQQSQAIADDEERQQKWLTEMRNYKHDFMIKELDLKKEQQRRFFAD